MSPARRRSKSPSTALLSFDEAAALVAVHAAKVARIRPGPRSLGIERVRLNETFGRVLAEPLRADADQPPFARSTRDGFACRAAEVSTHRPLAVVGSTRAGQSPSGSLPRGSAWEIMTGAPVPSGADAVVMLEHVDEVGSPTARAIRLLPPRTIRKGENIVARGAQARKGDKLLPPGTLITAAQIALAAVLRLDKTRCLPEAARGHPLHRRRACRNRFYARPQPDSQLEQRHAGGNGLRCRRRSVGAAHRSRTQPHPSTPRSPARQLPIFFSSPAASPQASSIWSNPLSSAPEHDFTSLAFASSPASLLVFAEIPRCSTDPHPKPKRHEVLLLRAAGQSRFFRRHFSALRRACCGRPCRTSESSGLASLSRVSPRTSKPRPASPAFSPLPALLPAPSLRSRWFPGRARAISPPWLAPTVSWSCRKTPIAFAQARLSAFCFPEEFLCQSPSAARPRASRTSTHPARPPWSTSAPSSPRAAPQPHRPSSSFPQPCSRLCPRTPRAIRLRSRASPAFRPPSAPPISSPCAIPLLSPMSTSRPPSSAAACASRLRVSTTGPTGVEMEALTAAAVAALTVYDMTKALDKAIVIRDIRLESKSGGKSGDFQEIRSKVHARSASHASAHCHPRRFHSRLEKARPRLRRTVRKW